MTRTIDRLGKMLRGGMLTAGLAALVLVSCVTLDQQGDAPTTVELLDQYREVRKEAARAGPGEVGREAALVLGWGQFFSELAEPVSAERADFVQRKAGDEDFVRQRLADALQQYRAVGDNFRDRRGRSLAAYVSALDGSGVFYDLSVPSGYDPSEPYPLVVLPRAGVDYKGTHGGVGPEDRLVLRCSVRAGIVGLGELATVEALREVRRHYNVDPNRIYLRGGSIGGGAAWRMAARYPDLWAGAQIDYGWSWTERLHLENVAHLPLWIYHDVTDKWVPVDESRLPARFLARLGAPVVYSETTGGGHSRRLKDPDWNQFDWLLRQRRVPHPRRVMYTTTTAERGQSYWLEILEFTDPNALAGFRARVQTTADGSSELYLRLDNVDVLRIEPPVESFSRSKRLVVYLSGEPLPLTPPLPEEVYVHRLTEDDTWVVSVKDPRPARGHRPYSAGGLNLMYSSPEPLLIVRGTGGDDEYVEAVRTFCKRLSYHATGWWPFPMGYFAGGAIPVKADAELTAEDIKRRNLVLVGSASSNSILARITERLPAVEHEGKLRVGSEIYSLSGRAYGLLHYNPEAPSRLIFAVSSPEPDFYANLINGITERMADERPLGLVLVDVDPLRWVRQIAWGKGWSVPRAAMEDERLPPEFAKTGGHVPAYLEAMRRATGADLALAWGPTLAEAPAWDVRHARWSDLRGEVGQAETIYVGLLPGAKLRKVAEMRRAGESNIVWRPDLATEQISASALCRVCLDPRMARAMTNDMGQPLQEARAVRVDVVREMERNAELRRAASQTRVAE